ncbi:MAG: substrate-binding domain-containing protein [Proteobacteria bacterium]|nr:substrate-binding domain-containing protein [Pseudomonadota bacterium]
METSPLWNNIIMMRVAIKFRSLLIAACIFWYVISIAIASDKIYIIANTSVPVNALSETELRDIYIGKEKKWGPNLKIVPVIMPSEKLHDKFVVKFTRKSSTQFKNWWMRLMFTGEGLFPKTAASEKDLIEKVSETEGAIGYASTEINTDTVKTIMIYDKDEVIKKFEKNKDIGNE